MPRPSANDDSWRVDGDSPHFRRAPCVVFVITGENDDGPDVQARVFDTHLDSGIMVRLDSLDYSAVIGTLCDRCGKIIVE